MTSPTLEQRLTDSPEVPPTGTGSSQYKIGREFIADTTTCVTFGFVVGGLNETLVIGLPFYQMIASRAATTVQNVCLGGLYGKYSNLIDRVFGISKETGKAKQAAVGILSNATFWVPLYEVLLRYVVGVTDEHTLTTTRTSAIALCAVTGAPYNAYLRYVRGLFGCAGNIDTKCDENARTSG
ncbi:MAG: L-alanine exporter AlaE [Nanoarchaeota archaeon]